MKGFAIMTLLILVAMAVAQAIARRIKITIDYDNQMYDIARKRVEDLFTYFQNIELANLEECLDNKVIVIGAQANS